MALKDHRRSRLGGQNAAATSATGPEPTKARSPYSAMHTGPGRTLTAVYGVFALSATARAGYQLIREFDAAPIAYSLSALAAIIYIVATVCLVIGNRTTHRLAIISCIVEFIGVVVVGILSFAVPADFAQPSVWSGFGSGYGYIPFILPLVGLWWLIRVGKRVRAA